MEDQDQVKYYRLRAKEYRERYEGMRTLEWQTLLQTYAGYGAIAVAFQQGHSYLGAYDWWVRCGAMVVTMLFFVKMQYLHYRIEERLITFQSNYVRYTKQELVGKDECEEQGWGTSKLGHQFFWTYDTQMFLSTLAALTMLIYQGVPATPKDWTAWRWLKILFEAGVVVAFVRALMTMRNRRGELQSLLDNFRQLQKGPK